MGFNRASKAIHLERERERPNNLHDTRCNTGNCDEDGSCICRIPVPSTILDGDRPFLGGQFCDEVQMMCDGTNSFWCEHGGTCVELVHGENYSCRCLSGFVGVHCEHTGAPCGEIFCFHHAECLVEGSVCECPPDWKGSFDCSLPTKHAASVVNSTHSNPPHEDRNGDGNWYVTFIIVCSLGAIAGAVIVAKKYYKKPESMAPKFQQLAQVQIQGFLDDDDEEEENDCLNPQVPRNDKSHL
ncbi:neurogenic locus notch homolog protein 1 isoform X2 [Amborella trichopoda]|uniref:neurogenic locus notch homolog protein 1 isoform X2 n=1 Tax=Amborella trichopoda TaxID=13333 RepID=UPI0009BD07FE|nr:neurogenic locus notch homolog protein 1 isoform X2 [Amborella trichopoda]|eukprot:XP_020532284.1 neurogenic locus notch homolog protein 1 isoform X2 [Amborella trichopoda]